MKLGDLIKHARVHPDHDPYTGTPDILGVVIDIQDKDVLPPIVTTMWETGAIEKIYSDELEVVSESR